MGISSLISERIFADNDSLIREVKAGRFSGKSIISTTSKIDKNLNDHWDRELLHGKIIYPPTSAEGEVVFADIFCGAGGLSQGIKDACLSVGLSSQCAFGADQDDEALAVFCQNLQPSTAINRNIASLVDYLIDGQADSAEFVYPPELLEENLAAWVNKVSVLVGGPPCQGHSNLNNKTRREDPRNMLYLSVPALAVALKAKAVVIENVPDVRQDKASVFATAWSLLESEGYQVDSILMNAFNIGVPQTRKRLFLVATKGAKLKLEEAYAACARPKRSIWFAIDDLEESSSGGVFGSTSNLDAVSQGRIDYLFDHDLYELPNEMRPDCHKEGHSYPSVYGRLRKDQPAGTITQGFNTIGRGRYIHPTQRRSITPHEATRIQGFSDTFNWMQSTGLPWPRSTYAKLIGNAVPPRMGYAIMLAIIDSIYG